MNNTLASAWVLESKNNRKEAALKLKSISLKKLSADEVRIEPLYGCMEGNYVHALQLRPDNIFNRRNTDEIILGNAGVVKVKEVGCKVTNFKPGDRCIIFGNGQSDDYGYPVKTTAFDKKDSMGVFGKVINISEKELLKIPEETTGTLQQWAAFSVKYISAWSNWKVAYQAYQIQMPETRPEDTYVFGWGGGTAFAELTLAKHYGCQCFMLTSKEERMKLLKSHGITGINRESYSRQELIDYIQKVTKGNGVSIFIDNIGQPVYEITLKTLGRQGVIATSGWKEGGFTPICRENECKNRHIHVYTHYAGVHEGNEAIRFAEQNKWFPTLDNIVYDWSKLDELLVSYSHNDISSWFPIFRIN